VANNPLSATDADGEALTFAKVSGPDVRNGNDDDTWDGNCYGNVALAPGFSDSGTATVSVSATDGSGGSDGKSFTVTVNNVNRAPVLAQPANVTVNEGAVANTAFRDGCGRSGADVCEGIGTGVRDGNERRTLGRERLRGMLPWRLASRIRDGDGIGFRERRCGAATASLSRSR